jgi:hypothetical protein
VKESELNNHVKRMHIQSRNNTNLDIVHDSIYDPDCGTSHWSDALAFLETLPLDPPPFRQTLISKISHRLEQRVTETFCEVINATNEALKPAQYNKHKDSKAFDPYPVLLLQIHFERLVLFPIVQPEAATNSDHANIGPKRSKTAELTSVSQTIHERLRLFKQGQIHELYQQSLQVISKTPKQYADSPPQTHKSAQLAANLNNYKSAIARLIQNLPVAKINESKLDILRRLHPKSLGLGCFKKGHNTRTDSTVTLPTSSRQSSRHPR